MSQIIEEPNKILENIKTELLEGVKNRHHGFHTPVFSNFKNSQLIFILILDQKKFKK